MVLVWCGVLLVRCGVGVVWCWCSVVLVRCRFGVVYSRGVMWGLCGVDVVSVQCCAV